MRLIEIDIVSLQTPQRILDRAQHVRFGETFFIRSHLHTELCGDDHLLAIAAPLDPVADHRFGFATLITWHPFRVDVGVIDEIESRCDKRIQQLKRRWLVYSPAKNVAAESEWGDF